MRPMTPATVQVFYAILALLAFAFVAIVLVVRIAAVRSSTAHRWYRTVGTVIEPNALGMAFVVAMLATIGSLYFSEVAHFDPCRLCWYQRIAMYPLVVVLGIAAVRRDADVGLYVRALAGIGALISAYHLALEWIPALDTGAVRHRAVVHGHLVPRVRVRQPPDARPLRLSVDHHAADRATARTRRRRPDRRRGRRSPA